jgi:exonuclease VII small subunit
MWTKENNNHGVDPPGTTDTLEAYEEAMKEFATSAAEFMEHVALLTRARDSYQRAMAVSTRLRDTLDTGDEILRTLMVKVQQAVDAQPGKDASDQKKPEALNVETIKATREKADAARA